MEETLYILDQHHHIVCTCTQLEAQLELLQGLPEGYEIVNEYDEPLPH